MELLVAGKYGPVCRECSQIFCRDCNSLREHLIRRHKVKISRPELKAWLKSVTFSPSPALHRLAEVDPSLPIIDGYKCGDCGEVSGSGRAWRNHKDLFHDGTSLFQRVKAQAHPGRTYRAVTEPEGGGPQRGILRFPVYVNPVDDLNKRYEELVDGTEIFRGELWIFYKSLGLHSLRVSNDEYATELRELSRRVHTPTKEQDRERWNVYENIRRRVIYILDKVKGLEHHASACFKRGLMQHQYGDSEEERSDPALGAVFQSVGAATMRKYSSEFSCFFAFLATDFFMFNQQYREALVDVERDEGTDILFQAIVRKTLEFLLTDMRTETRNGVVMLRRSLLKKYLEGRTIDVLEDGLKLKGPETAQQVAAACLYVFRVVWLLHSFNGVPIAQSGAKLNTLKVVIEMKSVANASRQCAAKAVCNSVGRVHFDDNGNLLGYMVNGEILDRNR
eukprot:gb/GECG01004214.1/.p1 GENE.gb/GECG01004214.1/~~gb/GECG01004214.1/.p1  ORF type:complete len:449 (+),score=44.45 gb/GECG01004214.1/:1-1347(+)